MENLLFPDFKKLHRIGQEREEENQVGEVAVALWITQRLPSGQLHMQVHG